MLIEPTIGWSDCPLVEAKPTVRSGALVLRGTRMPVDAIVDNFEYGLSVNEIAEQFELSIASVEEVVGPPQCVSSSRRTCQLVCVAS